MAYFAALFQAWRAEPRADLITALVKAEEAGDQLSENELHRMVMLILTAGHETTVNLLANSVLTLLQHPAALSAEAAAQTVDNTFLKRSPAHLHINLPPDHQGRGTGSRLFAQFEAHLRRLAVPGLHLQTSNYNVKAVPFYRKMGFTLHSDEAVASHPLVRDYRVRTFTRTL